MAFMAIIMGLGPLFYILLVFRKGLILAGLGEVVVMGAAGLRFEGP